MIEWNGWYKVKDTSENGDWDDIKWANETFGPPSVSGRWFYEYSTSIYYFRNKNDALMYELGWTHATAS